ncbi:MAG: hypothetical protein ABMB14_03645 [Myxococcota bacterium]
MGTFVTMIAVISAGMVAAGALAIAAVVPLLVWRDFVRDLAIVGSASRPVRQQPTLS